MPRREPIFLKELEKEKQARDSGLFYYCSLGPSDKGSFDHINSECVKLGVPIGYSELPSGGRVYRLKRIDVGKLPTIITSQWNNIPHGLPSLYKGKPATPWSLSYVNALDTLCKEWVEVPMPRRRQRTQR